MDSPEHIVIFHPAAIGDAMLATPVAAILKRNFPDSRITYWSHASLKPLIDMCPAIDIFEPYRKGSAFNLATSLKVLRPDLFVDLSSNPLKGKLMAFLTAIKTVHYKKKPDGVEPIQHAVDNFIDTIRSVVSDIPDTIFPTLMPVQDKWNDLKARLPQLSGTSNGDVEGDGWRIGDKPMIAIVPGVGLVRPNRAWQIENWIAVIDMILESGTHTPVLIGGPDEISIARELNKRLPQPIDLCGKLSLQETAIVLKQCALVISADTGPAHIAVAVGTPVIGLYGPTRAERSGPFGCQLLVLSRSNVCQCIYEKECRLTGPGTAGDCMAKITPQEVAEKIELSLMHKLD